MSFVDTTSLAIRQCAETVIPKTNRPRREWISATTLSTTERKRAAKLSDRTLYNRLTRQVRAEIGADKDVWLNSMADDLERSAEEANHRNLYRNVKRIAGKRGMPSEVIKKPTGEVITDSQEKLEAWAAHFQQLLDRPAPTTLDLSLDFDPPLPADVGSDLDSISDGEIRKALRSLKSGKAAGPDEIPAELLKFAEDSLVPVLLQIFNRCWRSGQVPSGWHDALWCPVFKKGDRCLCSNYRGISLLDIPGKLYARVVSNKFGKWRDPRVREEQAGFREGRSCLDQIFCLRQSLSHLSTYARPAVVVLIDFAAAFDSVHRPSLWKIMRHEGVPTQIVRAMTSLYSDTRSSVRVYNQCSRSFGISSGVR